MISAPSRQSSSSYLPPRVYPASSLLSTMQQFAPAPRRLLPSAVTKARSPEGRPSCPCALRSRSRRRSPRAAPRYRADHSGHRVRARSVTRARIPPGEQQPCTTAGVARPTPRSSRQSRHALPPFPQHRGLDHPVRGASAEACTHRGLLPRASPGRSHIQHHARAADLPTPGTPDSTAGPEAMAPARCVHPRAGAWPTWPPATGSAPPRAGARRGMSRASARARGGRGARGPLGRGARLDAASWAGSTTATRSPASTSRQGCSEGAGHR